MYTCAFGVNRVHHNIFEKHIIKALLYIWLSMTMLHENNNKPFIPTRTFHVFKEEQIQFEDHDTTGSWIMRKKTPVLSASLKKRPCEEFNG